MRNNPNDVYVLMEGWRTFLNEANEDPESTLTSATGESPESRKAYTYCSVILDQASQKSLSDLVSSTPEIAALTGATPAQKLCHHMTIKMGTSLKSPLSEEYPHGKRVDLTVEKIVASIDGSDGISAAVISGAQVDSGMPHITLSLNNRKPFEAGKIGSDKLPQTFEKPVNLTLVGYVNIPTSIP